MKIFRVLLSLALLTSSVISYSATNDIYNLNVTPRSVDAIAFNVDDSNGTSVFSITNTGLVTIAGSFVYPPPSFTTLSVTDTISSGTLSITNTASSGTLAVTNTATVGTLAVTNTATVGTLVSTGGAAISGAATSINLNSNFATNINTGTSLGTVTIGGSANPVVVSATTLTLGGAVQGAIPLVFDGATSNANRMSLAVTDPTGARTATLPDASGSIPLFQSGFSATKLWVATGAVPNGATTKTTTMTGVTVGSKCVATGSNVSTNAAFIQSVVPGVDQVVVTVSADPGASGLDYTVICTE